MRSELLLRWFKDGRKTLAIGSARADEGASYLAANLAVLFAQMGRKVLLLDANMRQPRQHEIFNLGNGMGLSDILAERMPSLQVHTIKPSRRCPLLSAGSPPPNPANCWRGRRSARCCRAGNQLRHRLIDTAPAQLSSDFSCSQRVGGMLIATRRNVSRISRWPS